MKAYGEIIEQFSVKTTKDIHQIFCDVISFEWVKLYNKMSLHGEITIQNFGGFTFIIDDGNQLEASKGDSNVEILESRVVGAFGLSKVASKIENRRIMRKWIGATSEAFKFYPGKYDKGHFIAHGMGGPIDVNLFPQKREINRGWSAEGKVYRKMEKYITNNPGTFVFVRPIYTNSSFCPDNIEYGYFDNNLQLVVKEFSNK